MENQNLDFRSLCAELVGALEINDYYDERSGEMAHSGLLKRARAALACHTPAEPSEAEIFEHWIEKFPEYGSTDPVAWAYDVLQRWGSQTPKPIPISEKLPSPEHCCGNPRNGEGLWCWGREIPRTAAGTPVIWRLMPLECLPVEAVDWLPYWALPLPKLNNPGDSHG